MNKKCQVFTPENYVRELLDSVGYTHNLYGKKILENSCGDGNILVAVVQRYIDDCKENGLSRTRIKNGLAKDIYGIEIDEEQYKKCIDNLDEVLKRNDIDKVDWKVINADYLKWNTRAYIARSFKIYDDRVNHKEKTKQEGSQIAKSVLSGKKDKNYKAQKEKMESLAKTVQYFEEEREELITELKLLRALATNGLITTSIVHDLKSINALLVNRVEPMRMAIENNNKMLIERNLNDLYKNDQFLKSWITVVTNQSKKDKRKDGVDTKALPLMIELMKYGYEHCDVVILEGIMYDEWYSPLFKTANELYGMDIYAYYFDIPFEETVRRHNTRDKKQEFGEEDMRRWWREKDFSSVFNEKIITSDIDADSIVEMIYIAINEQI